MLRHARVPTVRRWCTLNSVIHTAIHAVHCNAVAVQCPAPRRQVMIAAKTTRGIRIQNDGPKKYVFLQD